MMKLIPSEIAEIPGLPRIVLVADRRTLAKRRWRGRAEDGQEFGFDLAAPLVNGAAFFATEKATYIVEQAPEPVLEVAHLAEAAQMARLGWTIGNLHFPIHVTADCIRVPDDPALRQLLEREKIPFAPADRVFIPFGAAHSHD